MGNLTGLQISNTFDGLLNTQSTNGFGGTPEPITDGLGTKSGLQIQSTGGAYSTILTSDDSYTNGFSVGGTGTLFGGVVDFQTSTVNFTNSTVIGLPADSDTTYTLSAVENNPDGIIRLSGSDASTNDVELLGGTNVNLSTVGNQITINAIDTNTTYDLTAGQNGANAEIQLDPSVGTTDVVTLAAGTNITLTQAGSEITIDAAGGGGTSKSIVITTGAVNAWAGPAGQDVIIAQALIPANTITGAATIEFRSPVSDGPEGQFNYSSFQIAPVPGDFNHIALLGRQASGGGPDSYFWYRSITVGANGTAYYIDSNGYQLPTFSPDPVAVRPMDWTIDQYFTITVWCDAANATWQAYSPSLTITNK